MCMYIKKEKKVVHSETKRDFNTLTRKSLGICVAIFLVLFQQNIILFCLFFFVRVVHNVRFVVVAIALLQHSSRPQMSIKYLFITVVAMHNNCLYGYRLHRYNSVLFDEKCTEEEKLLFE